MKFARAVMGAQKLGSVLLMVSFLFCCHAISAFAQSAGSPSKDSQSAVSAPVAPPLATAGNPAATQPAHADDKPIFDPDLDPVSGLPWYETINEDWSSLAVGISHLHPEEPLVANTEEKEHFTRTLVGLKWRPGDRLDVYVILPKGVKNPPAVLYLYNFADDTERFRNDGWCERVTGGGVAAIGFVSALSGHRFHDRPMKQWFVSQLQESLGSTVHDVKFILDYLATRGDIDMNRIGMFGQGSGATIALLAAAADPRIKAVDALDPWGDWPVWLAKSPVVSLDTADSHFTSPAFLKKVAPLDPVKWLPQLKTPYIRLQQNLEDEGTPLLAKNKIMKAAPKRTEVNRFDSTLQFMRAEGRGRLFDWIKEAVFKPVKPLAASGVSVAEKRPIR